MNRLREWWRAHARQVAWAVGAIVLASSPWWARAAASRLAYFRLRQVEIVGLRYASPDVVRLRLRPDTTMSVWDDLDEMERRIMGHVQIRDVMVRRRLPSTIVVTVDENEPVALVADSAALRAYDGAGRRLPIDPSVTPVDAPVIWERDTTLLRLLADLRVRVPRLYARLSDARRLGDGGGERRDELLFHFAGLRVRCMVDVTPERLAEIFPVEADLARRGARAAELDLRFRDQVIARLQ